jgi:hypothetical protein
METRKRNGRSGMIVIAITNGRFLAPECLRAKFRRVPLFFTPFDRWAGQARPGA